MYIYYILNIIEYLSNIWINLAFFCTYHIRFVLL